jgi:hypothetical protein
MKIKETLSKGLAVMMWVVAFSATAADKVALEPNDSVRALIERQAGKTVSLRLENGDELKGTLGKVQGSVVHLMRLNGREYEDAFIDVGRVTAVVVRVRDKL